MPKKTKKPCAYPGCSELVRDERFCLKHKDQAQKQRRERDQFYDTYIRDQKAKAFYKSRAWQAARRRALIRDHYLCQDCLEQNRITQADTVHHRVEISKDWSKRLDLNNLVSLCAACHNARHGGKADHD